MTGTSIARLLTEAIPSATQASAGAVLDMRIRSGVARRAWTGDWND